MLLLAAVVATAGCKKPKNLGDLFDGGGSSQPFASSVVTAPPVGSPPDAGPSLDAGTHSADLAHAQAWLADLQWCVAHKATQNPANAGEGDSSTECDAVAALRAKTTDPDVAQTLDDASALCGFDIPLVTANEALDHLRNSTSQASHLLMCTVATKEIAKAKAVHARDARVTRTEARRSTLCH